MIHEDSGTRGPGRDSGEEQEGWEGRDQGEVEAGLDGWLDPMKDSQQQTPTPQRKGGPSTPGPHSIMYHGRGSDE